MATKSISQLDTAATLDNGDLFETAIPDAGSASGYASKKMTLAQLADYAANDVVYPDFKTSAQSITGAVNQTLANFADEYDNTATYDVGDVVIYAGNLYKCETAVTTAETFDPTKWTQGKAADFFAGGGEDTTGLIAAGTDFYNYTSSSQTTKFVSAYLTMNDTLVVVITYKGTITVPADFTLIHASATPDGTQTIAFYKYEPPAAGYYNFTITQTSARMYVNWGVFRNCRFSYSGNFLAQFTNDSGALAVTNKTSGQMLFWGCSAVSWTGSSSGAGTWETSPADLVCITLPPAASTGSPRQALFYDDGTGATARTFSHPTYSTPGQAVIDAIEITPN